MAPSHGWMSVTGAPPAAKVMVRIWSDRARSGVALGTMSIVTPPADVRSGSVGASGGGLGAAGPTTFTGTSRTWEPASFGAVSRKIRYSPPEGNVYFSV